MNRTNKSQTAIFIGLLYLMVHPLMAEELNSTRDKCLLRELKEAEPTETIKLVIKRCDSIKPSSNEKHHSSMATDQSKQTAMVETRHLSRLDRRIQNERATIDNPAVITSHNRNYMLPITFAREPNNAPFEQTLDGGSLDNAEAKFQLSFKAPLLSQVFDDKDVLFFGFTLQSYWQLYNSELSSPFRETNYQPEIFYAIENDTEIGQWTNKALLFGIEHQSNGRTQAFSRSWNRVYANFVFEKDDWLISFKPWYRLPEKEKTEPNQADGDDNPDIDKYMGHFELSTIYSWDEQNFSLLLRNNLRSENRGALQIDWTFPLGKRFKGYFQYFNGYGESLIDYDHNIERIGFGVALTDFL
ncbi:MAG: phospholipase A [Kangiellaceae bacterium]|nr:phospholipase A [Kangiellaceae bacterium]